jgi:hypothetical protein
VNDRWLGILMLDTKFPRPVGDVGHPASWRMPVRYRTVPGASPQRVVREQDGALVAPFVDAARALQAEGAAAITTGCGFLIAFQDALQAAVDVPVWTSSLLALPHVRRPGVITVDAAKLSVDAPVEGLEPGCGLQRTLLDDLSTLDVDSAEANAVAAAMRLVRPGHHPIPCVHKHWESLQ